MSAGCCWCGWLLSPIYWVGIFYGIKMLYYLGHYLYLMFLCKELPLLKRYGSKSWALITGSTDGIGWNFANSLGSRGFNIILTGRSKEKLTERAAELRKAFSGIDVDTVQVDFAEDDQVDNFLGSLKSTTKDISVLVNNVGTLCSSRMGDGAPADLKKAIKVNCIVQSLLLNEFLPRLAKRSLKSAVIDVGSMLALSPTLRVPVHAATKTFNTVLSAGSYADDRYSKIDHLCLMPGWTKTHMLKNTILSVLVAKPEEVVEGSLRHLGHTRQSFGSNKHFLNAIIRHVMYEFVPLSWRDRIVFRLEAFLRTIPME